MWWIVFGAMALSAIIAFVAIGVSLNAKGKRLQTAIDELNASISHLIAEAEKPGEYQAPDNNVLSNPVDTTKAWLERRAATERKKVERQRRLISRLTKRK